VNKKVLILGDGLLGSELVKQTGWDYLSRKKDNKNLFDLLPIILFSDAEVIVNCIANTNTYSDDKKNMMEVNYAFVVMLVNEFNLKIGYKKKLVQISTDYVYSNSKDFAKESDVPVHNPTWYGYSKILADGYIENFSNDYLICRMTHKPKPFPYEKAWKNQIGNFDYVDEQVKRLIKLINNDASGIVNVGGEEVSMYELAKQTKKDVEPNECDFPVPNNVTMNIDKINGMI
jgi:dTDP-4-dehydrorhamnose reductase